MTDLVMSGKEDSNHGHSSLSGTLLSIHLVRQAGRGNVFPLQALTWSKSINVDLPIDQITPSRIVCDKLYYLRVALN